MHYVLIKPITIFHGKNTGPLAYKSTLTVRGSNESDSCVHRREILRVYAKTWHIFAFSFLYRRYFYIIEPRILLQLRNFKIKRNILILGLNLLNRTQRFEGTNDWGLFVFTEAILGFLENQWNFALFFSRVLSDNNYLQGISPRSL